MNRLKARFKGTFITNYRELGRLRDEGRGGGRGKGRLEGFFGIKSSEEIRVTR